MTVRVRARHALLLAIVGGAISACGGNDSTLRGAVIEPAPDVSDLSLPHALTGASVPMRAPTDEVRLVYFGYTNCPDVCPTTLADVKLALRRLPDADADRVSLVMATVDPERDLGENLQAYVESFVANSSALRTLDDTKLRAVATRFGVDYSVSKTEGGDVEVAHTGTLYAVNEAGRLVDQWSFDPDESAAKTIEHDLRILLRQAKS